MGGIVGILCRFDDASADTLVAAIQYGVLSLGHGALRFVEFYMHSAVLSDLYAYRLIGLAIAEFCRALERSFFGRKGDPVKAAHFAGNGIKRGFVAV